MVEAVNSLRNELQSEKSKKRYERERDLFTAWYKKKNVRIISENVILVYFFEKSKVMKSSTLWSIYFTLMASLYINHNIDIISKFGFDSLLEKKIS